MNDCIICLESVDDDDEDKTEGGYDDEEDEKKKELINEFYEEFVELVAESRDLSVDKVRECATGEIFTAKKAKTLGLVDEVGDKKTVADRVSETTKSLEVAISSLGDANSQAAVLEQAKTWFAEHDHGPDLACPVCQRGIEPSVLSSSIDTS